MRGLRWSLLGVVVAGVVVLSGCQMPFKCISRAEFDRYVGLENLNKNQATIITSLTADKERLTNDLAALRATLGSKDALIAEKDRLMEAIRNQMPAPMPGQAGPDIEVFSDIYGNVGLRAGSDVLFDAGKDTLKPEGQKVLQEVAAIVADKPNKLAICGFTDSTPIKYSGWESNFELSGARALAVLKFLEKQGISPERMHFAGYGEYALITGPDGKEDKTRSRRAEIVLLNTASAQVPAPAVVPK